MIALAAGIHPLFQELLTGASALSRLASSGLVAAIWQGILLAAAAALALRLLPRTPAAVRFAVWFAVFALVTALPFVSFVPYAAAAAHSPGLTPWVTIDARWTLAIAAVWAMASLVRAVTLAAAALRVRALWKRATPIEIEIAITGSRHAQVCVSADVDRPTVIGFLAPKILIPGWLLEKLTPAELEQVVLHEAGHLGRADDWMNLLQKIALVIFPLNPALAWVERRLCFERELACDERVLHALAGKTGAATQYASCLATLAEYRLERRSLVHGLALALGALGTSARESELGRRVGRILRPAAKMRPLHARLVMGGVVLGLLVATTALEHCPQLVAFGRPTTVAVGPAIAITNLKATTANGTQEQGISAQGIGLQSAALRNVSLRVDAGRVDAGGAQAWKSVGDAAPLIAAASAQREGARSSESTSHSVPRLTQSESAPNILPQLAQNEDAQNVVPDSAGFRATPVHAAFRAVDTADHIAPARRQRSSPDSELVVTRWVVTTWQARDGARLVETRSEISRPTIESDFSSPQPEADPDRLSQQQQSSPYAAVPVPGGWLVFQL